MASSSASSSAPPEAELASAALWWYEDSAGTQQGPHPAASMRGWVDAGYMPPNTLVAPSYYGEVPAEMWPISALWSDPASAFVLSEAASLAGEPVLSAGPDFIACEVFSGGKLGYCFRIDDYGLGYYRDEEPPVEVTVEELEDEQRERVKRQRHNCRNETPAFDGSGLG